MSWKDLATTLAKRFGLGESPPISRRLYGRLEREAERYGEPVMRIIGECAESASCARKDEGAWFRAAVAARLREHGFLLNQRQEQAKDQVAELRGKMLAAMDDERGRGNG